MNLNLYVWQKELSYFIIQDLEWRYHTMSIGVTNVRDPEKYGF